MRTKFEVPHEPSYEERLFIELVEKYGKATVDGICQVVFGKKREDSLERELRRYKERYHNFKYLNHVPKGIIVKAKSEYGNDIYKLITTTHPDARKIVLKSEFDKLCYIIQNVNTRRILGDLVDEGQFKFVDDYDLEELIEYRDWLKGEL